MYKKFDNPNLWEIVEKEDVLEISFGIEKLLGLRKAINGIPLGKGDYAIYDKNDNSKDKLLYIWWNLEK